MTMTLLNEDELIIYDNIRSITEYETYIALHPLEDRLVTIEVNRHLIASSDEIIIDKRCFVCDEIFLDFDNRIIKKQVLNSAFGKEVMRRVIRTILVTHCRNTETGETKLFYGRYDPVTLARKHWQAFETTSVKYSMTDEEFAKHAKIIDVKEN